MSEYTFISGLIDQLPDIPPDSIVSRTVLNRDDLKVIIFGFAAGQELSEHTAARPAVLYFVSGDADLVLGDDPKLVGPGAFVHMAPNLPHSVLAKTELVMLLLLL